MPPKASATSAGKPPTALKKAAERKRAHDAATSGDSPVKKREAKDDAPNRLFLVGFTTAEIQKHQLQISDHTQWAIDETLSDSVTHLVIKSMGTLKSTQQLLPVYYAVMKDIWVLKPSFLPHAPGGRRKSLGAPPLKDEKEHEFTGKEIDANAKAKADFPSISDILRISAFVSERMDEGRPGILGTAPFRKVAILAGRAKDSKQRKEELKLVMQAAGATVVDDAVLKTWKAKRKKDPTVEKPSMVVVINGEKNVASLGLEDEAIRDLLRARSPLFYEEFIMHIFMHTMIIGLDDLLLQSFVFIHETMKSVDPDGKLQARVMGDDDEDEGMMTTPAARRANSRVTSTARETSGKEGKEKKEDEETGKAADPTKKDDGKKEEGKEGKKEDETPKAPKKEVQRGRPKKEENQKDDKKGEKKDEKKEDKKGEKKEDKEVKMDREGVDPSLLNGNDDLLGEFEKEIDEGRGRREERSERELRELREMREDRGDEEADGEQPEPIMFSQLATQPPIEIPDELLQALQGKNDDDANDLETLREEMNNERGRGGKKLEDEEEEGPIVEEPASELALMSAAPIMMDEAKESEACNPLGTQHLYINMLAAGEIEDHFAAPRLDWFDFILDVKERMPWIQKGKVLRPARKEYTAPMQRSIVDLFYSFYHELNDLAMRSLLLAEINSSDAMEMYECEYEEKRARRPPVILMIRMLHEFAAKRHAEDLNVPERACVALENTVAVILPSSEWGRRFWLTVLAGGKQGVKGRPAQRVEEIAKRAKNFIFKTLISGLYHRAVIQFVVYFCEVDLLCAQTPVVALDLPWKRKEEESMESQRSTRAKKANKKKKRNPLEKFPLVLLLIMDLDEEPRRGLSEAAVLVVQKLMELAGGLKRCGQWNVAELFQRALLCLLEAARWHCSQAASSALTGAERRRVKAAESAVQSNPNGLKVTVELQQNIQRVVRWISKKGMTRNELRDILCLGWLEDILTAMDL